VLNVPWDTWEGRHGPVSGDFPAGCMHPPLAQLARLCYSLHGWLELHAENVAVVMCSVDVRTSVLIACYLRYCGEVRSARSSRDVALRSACVAAAAATAAAPAPAVTCSGGSCSAGVCANAALACTSLHECPTDISLTRVCCKHLLLRRRRGVWRVAAAAAMAAARDG
jgi:hypothetical protein